MPSKFNELPAKMSPARRKRIRARTKETLREMLLSELRK